MGDLFDTKDMAFAEDGAEEPLSEAAQDELSDNRGED